MRLLMVVLAIAGSTLAFQAEAKGGGKVTKGYVTKKGTYVAPYRSTSPNRTQYDNYNTKGNVNPYTGRAGTRTPTR